MTSKAQIFISQVEAPFLNVLDKSARYKVYDLLIAYADFKQKAVTQPGEQVVPLWNCMSVEVTDIMTAFYIDRMLVYHAAKIARYQQTLGGSDGEAEDSEEESDDESELVTHDRRIVATAEEQEAISAIPSKNRPLSLSSPLVKPSRAAGQKTKEHRRAVVRSLMEKYRADLRAEWTLEIRQDAILED